MRDDHSVSSRRSSRRRLKRSPRVEEKEEKEERVEEKVRLEEKKERLEEKKKKKEESYSMDLWRRRTRLRENGSVDLQKRMRPRENGFRLKGDVGRLFDRSSETSRPNEKKSNEKRSGEKTLRTRSFGVDKKRSFGADKKTGDSRKTGWLGAERSRP